MRKTVELGPWLSLYFENHSTDGENLVVGDGMGRRFIYSQVDNPRGSGLATKMSLEWELPHGETFKPFSLEIIGKEGNEDEVALRIQAQRPRWSGFSGVSLNYKDNRWTDRGGIWYDRSDKLRNWPAIMRDDVPVSNRFEYCVPVDMGVTIPLWLMKLENGDFSMPAIVPVRTVRVEDFEWDVPFQAGGTTFFPENTRRLSNLLVNDDLDMEKRGRIYHKVILIGTAMRVRFSKERI